MASQGGLFGIRSEVKKHCWEESDFPIACERCLGTNPYMRMMKTNFDRACRICQRPFTVFRWRPGNKERFKKTEICQVCARFKNACQACLFDLQTGVPLSDRDKAMELDKKFEAPKDFVNRDYWAQLRALEMRTQVEKETDQRKKQEEEVKALEEKERSQDRQ